jgi:hypothetical protein
MSPLQKNKPKGVSKFWYLGSLIPESEWNALPWEKRHESNNVISKKKERK